MILNRKEHSPSRSRSSSLPHLPSLQQRRLQNRYAQLLRTTGDLPMNGSRCSHSTDFNTIVALTVAIMFIEQTAGMDETSSSMLCWNETKPPIQGTWLEQVAARGAKMSSNYQSRRILQIIFAAITAVLTQGKWPGNNCLRVDMCLNLNCPPGISKRLLPKWNKAECDYYCLSRQTVRGLYLLISAEKQWAITLNCQSCVNVTQRGRPSLRNGMQTIKKPYLEE